MVDQPLGEAVGEHQFAVGHGDEAVAQRVEPELRPARLADTGVQVLHAAVDMAGPADIGREHPAPAVLGEMRAFGAAAFEDGGELSGDGQFQRLAGLGFLDPQRHGVHVHLRPSQAEHLGATHAGIEADAEGVAGDGVAHRGLDALVPAGQHLGRRLDAAAARTVGTPAPGAPLVDGIDDADAMARHFRRLAGYLGMREVRRQLRDDRSWFEGATKASRPTLRLVTPTADTRYVNCVPLVPLKAAAGAFGDPQSVLDESEWDWVALDTQRSLRPGMFVAEVVGRSMESMIPDGAYCLFASPVTGTRQGRIVLLQLQDEFDPDTGLRYTVKRYRSEKTVDEDGWRHVRIALEPVNREFTPIELTAEDEEAAAVVAEFVEIVGMGPPTGSPDD